MNERSFPKPPAFHEAIAGLAQLHLAHGKSSRTALPNTGLGYNRASRKFVLYSYVAWPDKDGHGIELSAVELLGFADELKDIGADWLMPVLERLKTDDSDADKEIIAAYRKRYGTEPRGSSN